MTNEMIKEGLRQARLADKRAYMAAAMLAYDRMPSAKHYRDVEHALLEYQEMFFDNSDGVS